MNHAKGERIKGRWILHIRDISFTQMTRQDPAEVV